MGKKETTRWGRRERKYKKRRYGMRVSGRSIKAVLLPLIGTKAKDARKGARPPFLRDPARTSKRKRRKKRR